MIDVRKRADTNEWQIREIQATIEEANAGNFASEAEVKAFMDKWNAHTK